MSVLLLVAIVVGLTVFVLNRTTTTSPQLTATDGLADALADARRWTERLGSQVLTLSSTDSIAAQALADAAERHTAATTQLGTAQTVRQAALARESALEGLHYINAAREIMGLPTGPALPALEGQKQAGAVTETRTVELEENHNVTAAPAWSQQTPHYYPGGMVAGQPVPRGWYSEPWWASALRTGIWYAGASMLYSSLFHGMAGVAHAATPDVSGVVPTDAGIDTGADAGIDAGDDSGFFDGGFFGGGDTGSTDGGFFDGSDEGGFFDGGFFGGGDSGGFDFDFDF
ncbi:DUF1542 domain-containing protein [Corynebacterium sp. HS2168-gen11]|uniref:DUF1542 domain-containing protein n=1 Tax=Corynebacterium sp. HS2168-gen11 TaxID=2974027 RepID=UPI00216B00DA|nr:DUF1542 domain-containing protein [Corynebacterium sp. HS2168-gen11]MCS4535319.1 DUF1542 domain-containing protein [Corynebacterium sp. HS2168-gen11]